MAETGGVVREVVVYHVVGEMVVMEEKGGVRQVGALKDAVLERDWVEEMGSREEGGLIKGGGMGETVALQDAVVEKDGVRAMV